MTRLRGPYSVAFPVNFTSKGDTTRDAFRKHMDEITRIYGILTGLDADTMDSTAVSQMLNNWKPSMSFSDISGNLDASRVSGALTGATINGSKVTGTIAASKVSGKLTNANIDTGNVNGLENYVKGLISSNTGGGITSAVLENNGYAKFGNGFMLEWGTAPGIFKDGVEGSYTFPVPFPSNCFMVSLTHLRSLAGGLDDTWVQMLQYGKTGFRCRRQADDDHTGGDAQVGVGYIALGV